jgi:hypothetical protein
MIYNVIYPIVTTIDGDTFKDAIKNFVKLRYDLNLTNMIIADQSQRMMAKMNYYIHDGRNKVGINMFPVSSNFQIPLITNDEQYIAPKIVTDVPVILSPLPVITNPFMPNVIKYSI